MSVARAHSLTGKTRICPHCKSVILDSAAICPACQHHLRFGQSAKVATRKVSAFNVEGSLQGNPAEPFEYSVVISIRNQLGQEIKRQVIEVGAMESTERRTFNLSVEVSVPQR